MKTTYNDVLSGFESADVVAVVAVIHLLQDGDHAGDKTPLEGDGKHNKSQLLRPPTDKARCGCTVFGFLYPIKYAETQHAGNILNSEGLKACALQFLGKNKLLPGLSGGLHSSCGQL